MPKRTGGSRKGLLTEQEKKHLLSGAINPKILSKLCKKLDHRIEAAIKDLRLIRKTKHLEAWRVFHADSLITYFELISELEKPLSRPLYIYRVKFYGKGENRRYWMDHSDKATIASRRLLDTSFALSFVKNKGIREHLNEPLKRGILPWRKEDAMTSKEISAAFKADKIYAPDVKDVRKNSAG
jgi:hypothetical protein